VFLSIILEVATYITACSNCRPWFAIYTNTFLSI
jgi:hypothetical protein